jgi:hypothetical protein
MTRRGRFRGQKLPCITQVLREYYLWRDVKARCEDPRHPRFPAYGAKGVAVCERWHRFYDFLNDVGMHPGKGYVLGLVDAARGYRPGNALWMTMSYAVRRSLRARTRKYTYNGVSRTLGEWADATGLARGLLNTRINQLGWPLAKALTTPKQPFGSWGICRRSRDLKELVSDVPWVWPEGKMGANTDVAVF